MTSIHVTWTPATTRFNSTEVRLWQATALLSPELDAFQFYRSTIMTGTKKVPQHSNLVSILQKYDYDNNDSIVLLRYNNVSILQKYDYDDKLSSDIWFSCLVSILQKYDYDGCSSSSYAVPYLVSILQKYDYDPCHEMARILVKSCAKLEKNNEKNVDME